jgi:hypothetical protein
MWRQFEPSGTDNVPRRGYIAAARNSRKPRLWETRLHDSLDD